MTNTAKKAGFTLIELLVSIAIMAMIMAALYQVSSQMLLARDAPQERQDLVSQSRFAMARMVMFVQESDQIQTPPTTDPTEVLAASERLSDQYTNSTRVYTAAGDGLPDADTDWDGLVNEGGGDPAEFVTFDLDKTTDVANWKLREQMPNYGTVSTSDFKDRVVICEHVQAFTCTRLSAGIVEITLTLQQGTKAVTMRTTARARWVN